MNQYSFIKPIRHQETVHANSEFINYFLNRYIEDSEILNNEARDNFIKDTVYIVDKIRNPYKISTGEFKEVRTKNLKDQITFFRNFLLLSEEYGQVIETCTKDFRFINMMKKEEGLNSLLMGKFYDFTVFDKDTNILMGIQKERLTKYANQLENLYPISIVNLVYCLMTYDLMDLIEEKDGTVGIEFVITTSLRGLANKINYEVIDEIMAGIRFICLIDGKYNNIYEIDPNYFSILQLLNSFYEEIIMKDSFEKLFEKEDGACVQQIAFILQSIAILENNNINSYDTIISKCFEKLHQIDFNWISPSISIGLVKSFNKLNETKLDRDFVSKILLSNNFIEQNTLDNQTNKECHELAYKAKVAPFLLDSSVKCAGKVPIPFKPEESRFVLEKLFYINNMLKYYYESNSVIHINSKSHKKTLIHFIDIFRKQTPHLLKLKPTEKQTELYIAILKDIIRYTNKQDLPRIFIEILEEIENSELVQMQTSSKELVMTSLAVINGVIRDKYLYWRQIAGKNQFAKYYKNRNIEIEISLDVHMNKLINRAFRIFTNNITSFKDLKLVLSFIRNVVVDYEITDLDNSLSVLIKKTNLVIERIRGRGKITSALFEDYIFLINYILKNSEILSGNIQEDLILNFNYCLTVLLESEQIEIQNKISILYDSILFIKEIKKEREFGKLFEKHVLAELYETSKTLSNEDSESEIGQIHFTLGKNKKLENSQYILEIIHELGLELSEPDEKIIVDIFNNYSSYIEGKDVLQNLKILKHFRNNKKAIKKLLEGVFGNFTISLSPVHIKTLNLYWNKKLEFDTNEFFTYLIDNEIYPENIKQAYGIYLLFINNFKKNKVELQTYFKLFKLTSGYKDLQLKPLKREMIERFNLFDFTNYKIATLIEIPIDLLSQDFNFNLYENLKKEDEEWCKKNLNKLLDYMLNNDIFVKSFFNIIRENYKNDSEFRKEDLYFLNPPLNWLGDYFNLMIDLARKDGFSSPHIDELIYKFHVNYDYLELNQSELLNTLKDHYDFFKELGYRKIVKEDLYGLNLYNDKLKAFYYPSFNKILNYEPIKIENKGNLKGKFHEFFNNEIIKSGMIKLESAFITHQEDKNIKELVKRYFLWEKYQDQMLEQFKYPLELNNVYHTTFEHYLKVFCANSRKVINNSLSYKMVKLGKFNIPHFVEDDKYFLLLDNRPKHSHINQGRLVSYVNDFGKFFVAETHEDIIKIISLEEYQNYPERVESFDLREINETEEIDEKKEELVQVADVV